MFHKRKHKNLDVSCSNGLGKMFSKSGREPRFERVPGLYDALLMSADAMDENDIMGVRGPKQGCFVDIEKVQCTDDAPMRMNRLFCMLVCRHLSTSLSMSARFCVFWKYNVRNILRNTHRSFEGGMRA